LHAVAIHQRLQRQRVLISASRGDDSAFGIHVRFLGFPRARGCQKVA
jgi:hypothetical protein